jgi:Smg protein
MFDVLVYLFETYIHNELEVQVDQERLTRDLTEVGFHRDDIYSALHWLEKLADYQDGLVESIQMMSDPLSLRIYTQEECQQLDAECRGFILRLEQMQVLNLDTREMVIERVIALETDEFDLDDLKWVVLMVLFNIPGCEKAYQQMEDLLLDSEDNSIH